MVFSIVNMSLFHQIDPASASSSQPQRKDTPEDKDHKDLETAPLIAHEHTEPITWVQFMWEEGHDMTLAMFPCIGGNSMEEKLESPFIKYNPIYWLLWFPTALMLCGGRLVHKLFGQHDKVRHDELEVEHEVRVQWIYANDVMFFVSAVIDISALGHEIDLMAFHKHLADGHEETTAVLIGTVLLTVTILGNVGFYRAMKCRDQLGVRAAIAGNAGFAVIMTVLMVYGCLRRIAHGRANKLLSKSFFTRAMTVLFAIMAIPCYKKLWNAYEERPGSNQLHQVIFVSMPFIGVCLLVLLAFCLDHHALWETFG